MSNDYFYNYRENRSIIPKFVSNIFASKKKLKNIWDKINVRQPTGYAKYI